MASPTRTRRRISGAKLGTPRKVRIPRPRSACRRCAACRGWGGRRYRRRKPRRRWHAPARRRTAARSARSVLPVRPSFAFMPRVRRPEQTRRNAMRSRWLGSMFAWILKTKPDIAGSSGATMRVLGGARLRRRSEGGQALDQVTDAEIAQRAAEQDRRQMALAKRGEIERARGGLGERDLLGRSWRGRPPAGSRQVPRRRVSRPGAAVSSASTRRMAFFSRS